MGLRSLNKYLYGLAALLVLVVAGAVAVPAFIDWSRHKTDIAALIERATGRQAIIAGDISVSLLPVPSLEVRDVRVPSTAGPQQPDLLRFKSMRLELALLPLISGRIESDTAVLLEPEFALETQRNGRTNWHRPARDTAKDAATSAGSQPDAMAGGSFSDITLRHIEVRRGRVAYHDRRMDAGFAVSGIDADIFSDGSAGPFRGQGSGATDASPLKFSFRLGERGDAISQLNAVLTIPDAGMKAELSGDLATGADPGLTGRLRLSGEDAAIIASLAGDHPWRWLVNAAFAGRFTLEGGVAATADALGLIGFELDSDNNQASGSLAYRLDTQDASSAVTAALALQRIDLDRWFAERPPAKAGAPAQAAAPAEDGGSDAPNRGFGFPPDLEAEIDLVVEAIVVNRSVVRDVQASMRLVDGEITVNRSSAQLPGGTTLEAFGFVEPVNNAPRFEGYVEARSDNLRAMLDWLAIDVSSIPTDRLRRWSLTSNLVADRNSLRFDKLTTTLDLVTVAGKIAADLGPRPALSLSLSGNRLDLDAYFPRLERVSQPTPPPATGTATAAAPEMTDPAERFLWQLPMLAAGELDLSVRARLANVVYRGETLEAVEVEAAVDKGALTVREFKAGNIGGSAVRLTGRLGNLDLGNAHHAEFDLAVQRPQGFLGLFDLSVPPGRASGGPMHVALRLDRKKETGDWGIAGRMALGSVQTVLNGTGAYEANSKGYPLRLNVEADEVDLGVLLATLSRSSPPSHRTSQPAAPSAEAPVNSAAPEEAAVDLRSETPFSPDAMLLPRADLSLKVGTLTYAGHRLDEAELRLKTEPGAARVERLQGRLFGGNLLLDGQISGTAENQISVAANATLEGADARSVLPVDEIVSMSESTLGLRVALKAEGRSPRGLMTALKGEGRIWGEGGRIEGIDLAAANQKVSVRDKPVGLINVIAESTNGASKLSSFGGDFRLEDGRIQTRNLHILADGGSGEISGALDILRRHLEAQLRFRFAAIPDAPPIHARVKGEIGAARVTVEFNELQTWLSKQKGVEKVPRN